MAASGGFTFNASSLSTAKPTGITFGTPTATTSAATTGASLLGGTKTGFGFGGTGTTASGGGLFGPSTAAPAGGLALNLGLKTASSTGFSLNSSTTTKPGGLFGATPATTSGGLSLGGAAASGGLSLGFQGATKTQLTGLSLGGLSGTTSSGLGLGLGGTTATTASAVSKGLGGVDPYLLGTASAAGTSGTSSLGTSDNKTIKETLLPAEINATVTSFKDYVNKQKSIREEITRFSVKPYNRIQEEITGLKQLLAVVSNSLQRNAVAIHKLKLESAQELKNAEIAHRTQEIPPALQLENYAPTEYFQILTEQFEEQMHLCRQQIEQMESFMAGLAQPNVYTPQELAVIMVKLNETFIALAARLQSVHEAVRTQKDQYLNYRRVYHGEIDNIFALHKKATDRERRIASLPTGPRAFDNISNAAAIAMATALQTAQRPAGIQGIGLTGPLQGGMGGGMGGFGGTTGFGGTGTLGLGTSGFGGLGTSGLGISGLGTSGLGTTGIGTGGFGTSGFGTQTSGYGTQQSVLGTGLSTTSGFGSTSFGFGSSKPTGTATSFGGSLSAGPTVGGSTGFGFGSGTGGFGTTTTGKPLQLQKPPSKYRKGTR